MAEAVGTSAAPRALALRSALVAGVGALIGAAVAGLPLVVNLQMESRLVAVDFKHLHGQLVESALGIEMRTQAAQAAQSIDAFLAERIVDARHLAATPHIVAAVLEGAKKHEASSFHLIPPDELETLAGPKRTRGYFPEVDAFLRHHMLANRYFAEIFITDRNGFNVAYSRPTTDYVQSDEEWWQSAWAAGTWIGEVEVDRSAGALSIDVAIRIDTADEQTRAGVLKAVLDLGAIQELVSLAADASPGTLLTAYDAKGRRVAETASGHAADRILAADDAPSALPAQRSGFVEGEHGPTGYARTAGAVRYAGIGAKFTGLGWVVTAKLEEAAFAERLDLVKPLGQTLARAAGWPDTAALALALGAVGATVLAFAGCLVLLGRVDGDLKLLGAGLDALASGARPAVTAGRTRLLRATIAALASLPSARRPAARPEGG